MRSKHSLAAGNRTAAVSLAAWCTGGILFYGIPQVRQSYFSGMTGDNFPLSVLIPGLMSPITRHFLLYAAAGVALTTAIAAYMMRSKARLLVVVSAVFVLLIVACPIAHYFGSRKAEFPTLRDPEGKLVGIVYRDPSTVVGKEIDPANGTFKEHSGLIIYPNPQRDLPAKSFNRLIKR